VISGENERLELPDNADDAPLGRQIGAGQVVDPPMVLYELRISSTIWSSFVFMPIRFLYMKIISALNVAHAPRPVLSIY
jgi:hypothetical protein